ncbi:dTDP-4-dehydrorhamnose reductase [Caenispirillum salinarum AK4]|uniref:dTDP-4-dehydrorhamnose reductase n=1 Tax=Caenispirillum salinarum AK4 TaxID=1238182 RepID=K9GJI8_9PROT|nr:dTDP-4-dehydrorhamnose reductase [Caenispirillum salinarum]EKV26125.1 dTDP-4-dehydrorhamnose reductase [Caenispirillum salinarum AK4]
MRVLITGMTGQVGAYLAALPPPSGISWRPVDRAALDLSQPETVAASVDRLAPDVVVNAAAYTAVDRAETEPDLADLVNHRGPAALARFCAAASVPLIHLSTDYVFDGRGGAPYGQEDAPNPLNTYGRTKLAGERAVLEAGGPALVLRTAWLFSVRGQTFVRTMLRLGAEWDILRVVADQRGCPTAAADVAHALHHMLARIARGWRTPSGVWHLCGPADATWHDVAEALFDLAEPVWGRRPAVAAITTADWPTPAARPLDSRLDCAATVRDLGIACRPWRDALPEVVAAILARPPQGL